MPVAPLIDDSMVTRRVRVVPRQVVFVKSVFEASEGLGCVFAEHGGDLLIAAPEGRGPELDEVLADLALEVGAVIEAHDD